MMKETINYDDLKNACLKTKKSGGTGSLTKGLFGGMIRGGLSSTLRPMYPDPLSALLIALINKWFSNSANFSEDDRENIEHLIREGRRQGLEQMEIQISKDLGQKIGLSGKLPIENIPIGVSIEVDQKKNGSYVINVKFQPQSHCEDVEAIKQYAKLRQEGIISDEEFEKKKKAILNTHH